MNTPYAYKSFASRLKKLREAAGLTQTELGNRLGCSRGSISYYEQELRTPDIVTLNKACDFFGVSADYLLGRTNLRSPEPGLAPAVKYTGLTEEAADYLHRSACEKKPGLRVINALLSEQQGYLESIAENLSFAALCNVSKSAAVDTVMLQKDGTVNVSADIASHLFLDAAIETFRDFLEELGGLNG